MKKIETKARPFKLDNIKDRLSEIGIEAISVTDIRSSHGSSSNDKSYLTEDYFVEFLPQIKVEVIVEDGKVDEVVAALQKASDDGDPAESKIYIYNIEQEF